jgi:hypothetical protein
MARKGIDIGRLVMGTNRSISITHPIDFFSKLEVIYFTIILSVI